MFSHTWVYGFLFVPVIAVGAASAAGGEMMGVFHLYDIDTVFEYPAVSFGTDTGARRVYFVTDPPSDLQLEWDPSFSPTESVEIVLTTYLEETQELRDVAVLSQSANTGTYTVVSTALDEFNLGRSLISFKVGGHHLKREVVDPCLAQLLVPSQRQNLVNEYI